MQNEIKIGDTRKHCDVVMVVVRMTEKSVIYRNVYKDGFITTESCMKKSVWMKKGTPC